MKRFFTALMAIAIIALNLSLAVYANDDNGGEENKDILSYSCKYDSENQKIEISGTMNHERYVEYKDYTLIIYEVPFGMSEYDVVGNKPIAEVAVSVKFHFYFNVDGISSKYSRYAVFLCSPQRELTLSTEAQYPEISLEYTTPIKSGSYKGIATENASDASYIDAGTVILPIYVDSFISPLSNGYIHIVDDKQFYFDKEYVEKLDSEIASLSISGARVYLQILFNRSTSDMIMNVDVTNKAEFYMPDLSDEEVILCLDALAGFLSERYNGESNGIISGFITGKALDEADRYNYFGYKTLDKYTEACALYAIIVAGASRACNPSLDIVLPFMGNSFKEETYVTDGEANKFYTRELMESIFSYFDKSFLSGFDCTAMIESSDIPLGISNETLNEGIDLSYKNEESSFYIGNHSAFSKYLEALNEKYKSAADTYMLLWSPNESVSGNALACAYAYSFYKLLGDDRVSAFVISEENMTSGEDNLSDILHLMKYINTSSGTEVSKNLLPYFGVQSWGDIIHKNILLSEALRADLYRSEAVLGVPSSWSGVFDYFDFSRSYSNDRWLKGIGCTGIKADYNSYENRVMRIDFSQSSNLVKNEVVYIYEYPENMVFTPNMTFELQILDQNTESLAMYEVMFVLESDNSRFESSAVIGGNEALAVTFNIAEYNLSNMVDSFKICIRALDRDECSYSLLIEKISGYSGSYSSERLAELIDSERQRIRNLSSDTDEISSDSIIMITIGAILIGSAIVLGVFMIFKRDDRAVDGGDTEKEE